MSSTLRFTTSSSPSSTAPGRDGRHLALSLASALAALKWSTGIVGHALLTLSEHLYASHPHSAHKLILSDALFPLSLCLSLSFSRARSLSFYYSLRMLGLMARSISTLSSRPSRTVKTTAVATACSALLPRSRRRRHAAATLSRHTIKRMTSLNALAFLFQRYTPINVAMSASMCSRVCVCRLPARKAAARADSRTISCASFKKRLDTLSPPLLFSISRFHVDCVSTPCLLLSSSHMALHRSARTKK